MSSTPTISRENKNLPKSAQSYTARAYGAQSAASGLAALTIPRRALQPNDVQIEILYCGVCHTDIHWSRNDWASSFPAAYPIVPGHEIIGRVTRAGTAVAKFKEGDLVGVGCLVDSCRNCANCQEGEEQYCSSMVLTYNAPDKHLGGVTYGGYSESIVVDEAFALRVPEKMDLASAAPLLCAGITTYAPLRRGKARKGQKVGVIGLGGLGHMAVKFAAAMGANAGGSSPLHPAVPAPTLSASGAPPTEWTQDVPRNPAHVYSTDGQPAFHSSDRWGSEIIWTLTSVC